METNNSDIVAIMLAVLMIAGSWAFFGAYVERNYKINPNCLMSGQNNP
jgi:hypothetical protein